MSPSSTVTLNEQGRRICVCPQPSEHVNPGKKGKCVKCEGLMDSLPWVSSDETFAEFWTRLEHGLFPTVKEMRPGHPYIGKYVIPDPPEWFVQLRAQALKREREGRHLYGFAYMNRDNIAEANEEVQDVFNYLLLDHLKAVFSDGEDHDFDLLLDAAKDAISLVEKLDNIRHKRRGAP